MKINANIRLVGDKVILVPYRVEHVPTYHQWMKSPELQKLTASEPLNIIEEYKMQNSWQQDEDKCTFIILSKQIYECSKDEVESMIGDTNIYIQDGIGEISIMIANSYCRGKKYGWEAVILMMLYGANKLAIREYFCKISLDNIPSLNLFRKLQFKEVSVSPIFKEATFHKKISEEWIQWLECQHPMVVEKHELPNE